MNKQPHQTVPTIKLGAQKDAELIKEIIKFQKERKLTYPVDAVRILCKDALAMKKAMK